MTSASLGLYYFMIGDFETHKEIGSITDNSIASLDIKDHNIVLSNSKEIFQNSSEDKIKNQKNLIQIEKFKIYFTLKNNGTFYLACLKIDEKDDKNIENKKQKLVFDLIDDVDNIRFAFYEFDNDGCKFRDCKHINEIGCRIKEQVQNGEIMEIYKEEKKVYYEK